MTNPKNKSPAPADEGAPPTYAPWDGKRRSAKWPTSKGKMGLTKNVPGPLASLLERHEGNRNATARSLGFSSWGSIDATVKNSDKYRLRLHNKVMAAIAGDPIPRTGKGKLAQEPDAYKTGWALVICPPSAYEQIDEIAEVLGGQRAFRKGTKAGLILLYKFLQHEKTRRFKRLASHAASEVVCP
jgi:hypothetical protein